MFGLNRRNRFEEAVAEEMAYMLGLHGDPLAAAEGSAERARRRNISSERAKVLREASARLRARAQG